MTRLFAFVSVLLAVSQVAVSAPPGNAVELRIGQRGLSDHLQVQLCHGVEQGNDPFASCKETLEIEAWPQSRSAIITSAPSESLEIRLPSKGACVFYASEDHMAHEAKSRIPAPVLGSLELGIIEVSIDAVSFMSASCSVRYKTSSGHDIAMVDLGKADLFCQNHQQKIGKTEGVQRFYEKLPPGFLLVSGKWDEAGQFLAQALHDSRGAVAPSEFCAGLEVEKARMKSQLVADLAALEAHTSPWLGLAGWVSFMGALGTGTVGMVLLLQDWLPLSTLALMHSASLFLLCVSDDTTVMSSEARSSIETVQKKLAARVQKKAQEKARLVAQSASLLPWAFWFSWIGARDLLGWGGGANFEG